ncbi:ABC transporter permease [Glycocaulis profundi]|nr:ABC transporter permease [Glycocaulis profundi]
MTGASPHSPPSLSDAFIEALANLRSQGRRSLLALIGILIGTASIVALLNIGHIGQAEAMKAFNELGVDMIRIQATRTSSGGHAHFDRSVIDALSGREAMVAEAVPLALGSGRVFSGPQQANLSIVGATTELAALNRWRPVSGRLLRAIDDGSTVAVLGSQAAASLSAPGAEIGPGSAIRLGDYVFTVVGVLAERDRQMLDATNYANAVLIPLAGARRVLAGDQPNVVMVRLRPGTDQEAAGRRLSAMLADPRTTVQVTSALEVVAAMGRQRAIFASLLAAIGGVSLLVGGIGVMNVMLMSVMERRREIGLRAAVGATPAELRLMFLIEAGLLSAAGGVLGAVAGIGVSLLVAMVSGWEFVLAMHVLPLGPAVAGAVGLIFGLYPAVAASRLDPIEALRAV